MTSGPSRWLVKSEPFVYSWSRFVEDGRTRWDGVRNFEARNHLRAMRVGDLALFYHSNEGKEIVGVARVCGEAYADPTAPAGEDWSAVDLEPVVALEHPVSLARIRSTPALASMGLLRRSRLSVTPVSSADYELLLAMARDTTTAPRPASRTGGTRSSAAKKSGAAKQRATKGSAVKKARATRKSSAGKSRVAPQASAGKTGAARKTVKKRVGSGTRRRP